MDDNHKKQVATASTTASKNNDVEDLSSDEESIAGECPDFIDDEESVILDDAIPAHKAVSSAARMGLSALSILSLAAVKYAPFIEPRVIKGNLYGIAIDWKNQSPKGNIKYMTQSVADTYRRISSGSANFRVVAKVVKVNYDASQSNLSKAEQQSIAAVLKADGGKPKGPNDYFLIVNGFTHRSHTSISRHICHLANTLITTANHENGHSVGLLHSSVLVPGKPKEGSSLDGTSFMSIFSSGYLAACQNYYMGWLNQEIAVYDLPEQTTYQIQKFNAPIKDEKIKAVILANVGVSDDEITNPEDSQQPLFLSYPKFKDGNYLALHTAYGGKNLGSMRHKVFGSHMDYMGFTIDKIAEDDTSVTVNVSRSVSALTM